MFNGCGYARPTSGKMCNSPENFIVEERPSPTNHRYQEVEKFVTYLKTS
jgi:hypothetical protein